MSEPIWMPIQYEQNDMMLWGLFPAHTGIDEDGQEYVHYYPADTPLETELRPCFAGPRLWIGCISQNTVENWRSEDRTDGHIKGD